MTRFLTVRRRYLALPLMLMLALVVAGCATGDEAEAKRRVAATDVAEDTVTSQPAAGASAYDFPTGPAVLVPRAYEPPTDRVAATGGYLPVNGKPTLVFAESIT